MTTVEGLFHRYSSPSESQQLCQGLAPLVGSKSPAPVKCTKRIYNSFVNAFDDALSKANGYETVCTLLSTLRYISNGSPALGNGFIKFISFGLLEKISSWTSSLCTSALKLKSQPGWSKAADDILFTLTVVMNHSNEVKQQLIPMLPILLSYVSQKNLPCSAKIEATRGCNTLLEECSVEHRCTLGTKPQIKKLIQEMGSLIISAGDIELQVTMVECLFRLTSVRERSLLAQKWFKQNTSVLNAFCGLRDSEFEVDCRHFLNLLNTSVGKNRTVYSLPCKKAFLGTFELRRPADPGISQFWVDFNVGSQTVAMFVEDPYMTGCGDPEDSMWEYVAIRKDALKHWATEAKGSDLLLNLELAEPVHNLLPNLSNDSHTVSITFGSNTDPTRPCELVLGPPVKTQRTVAQHNSKLSKAIAPIRIKNNWQNPQQAGASSGSGKGGGQRVPGGGQTHSVQEISPIELPPNTPATGGHVNSQGSSVTPDHSAPPAATPATSTPKPRPLQNTAATSVRTPSSTSSKGALRPSLVFSSGGEPQSAPRKASLAMNTVVLGSKSRVITAPARQTPIGRTATPTDRAPPERNCGKENDTRQVAHEKTKMTEKSGLPAKGQPSEKKGVDSKAIARSGTAEKVVDEIQPLTKKRVDPETKQTAKSNVKRNEKPTSTRNSGQPGPKDKAPKVNSKKSLSRQKPTSDTTTKPATVSGSRRPTLKKSVSQVLASPDPYEIVSPVLKYKKPVAKDTRGNSTTTGKNLTTTSKSSNRSCNTSLADVTNKSVTSGATQLKRGGQQRVFTLSAAPLKGSKGRRGNSGRSSAASSINSSICSDAELNAIPDSMPQANDCSTATPYNSFLNDELELRPPPAPSKQRKRIQVPAHHDSFTFDSENDADLSWNVAMDSNKGKRVTSKLPSAKKPAPGRSKVPEKRQYKAATTKTNNKRPQALLASARTKKLASAKTEKQPAKSLLATSKTATSKVARKQPTRPVDIDENKVANKTRSSTATLLGRKRVIDDVYDPDFTPELGCPKPKMVPAAKKPPPVKKKKTAAPATKSVVNGGAKDTPSLPSNGKDIAARKLVMNKSSPKLSATRSRAKAQSRDGKKKQPPSAKETKEKELIDFDFSSGAHDKYYNSPAIPRVSASKPDLAERAQSRAKAKNLPSPKFDPYDISLVCPPSPKKPRLEPSRRSSGYFSGTCVQTPNSPSDSEHNSLPYTQDDIIKTNVQLSDDELERSRASSPTDSPSQQHIVQADSAPPSPLSLHSSQVEADLNITAGFEQICREFIARSGKMHQQPTTAKKKQDDACVGTKRTKQSGGGRGVPVAKRRRREQEKLEENGDEEEGSISLSPPPLMTHQAKSRRQLGKKSVPQSRKKTVPSRRPALISDVDSDSEATDTSTSDDESDSEEEVRSKSTTKTATAKRATTIRDVVDVGHNSDTQALISSFKGSLIDVAKSKKTQTGKLASKATREELLKLWVAHQNQRTEMSALFRQRLCRELEALEKEIKLTQTSEEKMSSSLKVGFKTVSKSLQKQQNQVDRMRALQLTYHEQVEQLEQDQDKQRVTAQRSLKKEMHSLQKKLLEDSQKREVARIKKSLHTMLMQL